MASRIAARAEGREIGLRGFEEPVRLFEVRWREADA